MCNLPTTVTQASATLAKLTDKASELAVAIRVERCLALINLHDGANLVTERTDAVIRLALHEDCGVHASNANNRRRRRRSCRRRPPIAIAIIVITQVARIIMLVITVIVISLAMGGWNK